MAFSDLQAVAMASVRRAQPRCIRGAPAASHAVVPHAAIPPRHMRTRAPPRSCAPDASPEGPHHRAARPQQQRCSPASGRHSDCGCAAQAVLPQRARRSGARVCGGRLLLWLLFSACFAVNLTVIGLLALCRAGGLQNLCLPLSLWLGRRSVCCLQWS